MNVLQGGHCLSYRNEWMLANEHVFRAEPQIQTKLRTYAVDYLKVRGETVYCLFLCYNPCRSDLPVAQGVLSHGIYYGIFIVLPFRSVDR